MVNEEKGVDTGQIPARFGGNNHTFTHSPLPCSDVCLPSSGTYKGTPLPARTRTDTHARANLANDDGGCVVGELIRLVFRPTVRRRRLLLLGNDVAQSIQCVARVVVTEGLHLARLEAALPRTAAAFVFVGRARGGRGSHQAAAAFFVFGPATVGMIETARVARVIKVRHSQRRPNCVLTSAGLLTFGVLLQAGEAGFAVINHPHSHVLTCTLIGTHHMPSFPRALPPKAAGPATACRRR